MVLFYLEVVKDFWTQCWPKSKGFDTKTVSKDLAGMILLSGRYIDDSLALMEKHLVPVDYVGELIKIVEEDGQYEKFSKQVVKLFRLIIDDKTYLGQEVYEFLRKLEKSNSKIVEDINYKGIKDFYKIT